MNADDIHPFRESGPERRNPILADAHRLARQVPEVNGPYFGSLLHGKPGWTPKRISDEIDACWHLMNFGVAGRNVVMADRMVEAMLERTDLGEVQVGDVKVPHRTTYVAFSPMVDIPVADAPGERVEGVYLTLDALNLYATVVLRGAPRPGPVRPWPNDVDRKFKLLCEVGSSSRTLRDVIDRHLGKSAHHDRIKEELAEEYGIPYVADALAGMDAKAREREASGDVIRRATMLALNVLCYATMRPDDAEPAYAADAPADLVERAAEKGRAGLKARQRLAREGHLPIVVVGRSVARERGAATDGTGISPEGHARRGHWRRQRSGKGLQAVTIIWIWPTMVNGGPTVGKVYRVVERRAQPA